MAMTRLVPFGSGLNDVAMLQNRLNSIFHEFSRPAEASETLAACAGWIGSDEAEAG